MSETTPLPTAPILGSAPAAPKTYLELALDDLRRELEPLGIDIFRMTIEESKILDAELMKKMSEQALTTAKTNADLAQVEQKAQIAKAKAEQDKEVATITQSQVNDSKVNQAQAMLRAAEYEAQALKCKAQAEADSKLIIAQADARIKELLAKTEAGAIEMKGRAENETLKNKAEILERNPALVKLQETQALSDALGQARINLTSAELGMMWNRRGMFFGVTPARPEEDAKPERTPGLQ